MAGREKNTKKGGTEKVILDESRCNDYKLEYIKWCSTLALSIVTYLIVAAVIIHAYHPDITGILAFAKSRVIPYGFPVAPEPKKSLLYLAALAVFSISLPGFYRLTNRCLKGIEPQRLGLLYRAAVVTSVIAIAFVTYRGMVAPNPYYSECSGSPHDLTKTNADFYFLSTFVYDNFFWYLFAAVPALVLYLLYYQKMPKKIGGVFAVGEKVVVYVFCAALTLSSFFISVFRFPYSFENKYDFNNVYYSVIQVFRGTPMLVDHFVNTYGLYPHFVVPVMKLFGSDVSSFSAIMGCLVAICFVFILVFLAKTLTSKAIILFGFTSVFFMSYVYGIIATGTGDPYFAMAPIRLILPCSLLVYAVYYLHNRSAALYYVSYFIFALGILWCPDFGIASYCSLVAFYCYLDFENLHAVRIHRKILFHGLFAVLGLAAAFSAYAIFIRLFYGMIPDLAELFSTIKIEALIGRGMLPMPATFHPWMLVVFTYIVGLHYAFYHIINKKVSPHSAIVFLLTMIGMASFSYYLKRSHNWNLFGSNPWFFLLLAVFADDLLKIASQRRLFIAPFALLVFFLSFSFFQTACASQKIIDVTFDERNREKNAGEQERIVENAGFIGAMSHANERILVFSADYCQGLYYGLSNTAAAINPGLQDMRLTSDYERLQSFLIRNDSTKIFFDPVSFRYCDFKIPMILSAIYDVVKVGEPERGIMFLRKKKENKNSEFILAQDSGSILHELFDKNFTNKLLFAEGGKGPVILGKRFTVEVIFRPVDVPASRYTWQSVFSNEQENGGMTLMQSDAGSPDRYIFGFSGRGVRCPVTVNKWNYLSFEVDSSVIKTYTNGHFMGNIDTKTRYRNSEMPFYVCNNGLKGGFFFGDIKELKISGNGCDPKEINRVWDRVQNMER
jgi:hypothetical protein